MAHEFVIKNGYITSGQSYVYNNLSVTGLTLSSVPTNDDTLTQILARDSSGNVKYRNASSLGGGSSTFTGGTVSGATIFTGGLSANTISATTYYNLPVDIRVTGGTYTNGTATFTNNTGGTFSVTGFSTTVQGLTGLTANNGLSASTTNNVTTIGFSGGTIPNSVNFTNGLTANTISATTYQGNIVTSISAGNNINVSQATGNVTVTAVPSNNTTAIQFNNSSSFAGDDATLAYILSQVVFVGGSASYTVGGAVTNSSIVGGEGNSISDNINRSVIIGGRSSLIRGNSISSVIIGGDTNEINNFNNTVILGGSNITATASDFVYVPSLNINTIPTNDDSLTQVLVRDSSGDVKYRNASTIGGGGTFTGGTVNGSTVFTNGLTANTLTVTGTTLSLGDITGNTLVSSQSSGDEGGEIRLSKAQTNTTLSGATITIDIYQNRLRFFESGSPNRGAYIDLTTASSGVGTNLLSGGGTFTGGTVTGPTTFTAGLTANTISATTYSNLPVTGLTQGSNITITPNGVGGFTIASTGGGSGTFTGGTVSGGTNFISGVTANTLVYSVVTLSSGATIAVDATLGNEFKVTLGGNSVLGNPTGAVDGQYLRFAIRQDATGARNLTFDTKYRFGNEIGTPSVDLTANKTSYLGVRYNAQDDDFDVISFVSGY